MWWHRINDLYSSHTSKIRDTFIATKPPHLQKTAIRSGWGISIIVHTHQELELEIMLWESILVSLAAAITTIQQAGGHPATPTLMADGMSRGNHFQLSINSTATVDSSPFSLSTSVTR